MKIFICEDDVKQRENMVSIINNYIMIEEKPMEIALATDDPYEVIEKSKEMNDVGCYFLDIQLEADINGIKLGSEIRKGEAIHTGVIPFWKMFQAAVKSCSQGKLSCPAL